MARADPTISVLKSDTFPVYNRLLTRCLNSPHELVGAEEYRVLVCAGQRRIDLDRCERGGVAVVPDGDGSVLVQQNRRRHIVRQDAREAGGGREEAHQTPPRVLVLGQLLREIVQVQVSFAVLRHPFDLCK